MRWPGITFVAVVTAGFGYWVGTTEDYVVHPNACKEALFATGDILASAGVVLDVADQYGDLVPRAHEAGQFGDSALWAEVRGEVAEINGVIRDQTAEIDAINVEALPLIDKCGSLDD